MSIISFSLVIGVILYYFWYKYKDKVKQENLRVSIYILLIGIVPMLIYLFLYLIIINSSFDDFYEYIVVVFITCTIFLSMWIFFALYGEEKKVELSIYIILGIVTLIFMLFMSLIEVLPNDTLESYLKPLISKGNRYDIWNTPPYQLAHFLTFSFLFPYIVSFIVSKIILKYKRYKN